MLFGLVSTARFLLLIQTTQSSLTGIVREAETGQPLAQAVVTLADLDRSVLSDASGRYILLDVPPGPQHLTIHRIGYAPRTLHALVPGEGQLQIDIALRSVPMQLPGILVRATVAVRGVESGDSTPFPDRGVSLAAVRNDPMLAEADGFLGLDGGEIAASPESPSGMHIRGGASDQTSYLLDGIPVLSPYHAAGTFSGWNPDALERLEVSSTSSPPAFSDALSGTISAATRTPGAVARAQGGMSTTQARAAVDGPLGNAGAGYLVSVRTGFPAVLAPRHDASYLRGETHDLIAKTEVPGLGGRLRLLLYDNGNSVGSSAAAESTGSGPLHNSFEWSSQSLGLQWFGRLGSSAARLQTWRATSDAEATWVLSVPSTLAAERQDFGVLAMVEKAGHKALTTGGIRLERSRTSYRVASGSSAGLDLEAQTLVGTAFIQHDRSLGPAVGTNLALAAASAARGLYLGFQTRLRWQLSEPFALSASYARSHQFSQSLRNPESVAGNIFPTDLYVGAGDPRVPAARNDRGVLAADYRPASGLRLGAQLYLSNYTGLVLVAPRTVEPFATTGFTTGSGTAPGVSLDAALSRARYGLLARYGWQHVRLEYADTSYVPVYGAAHFLELGAIVFPSATSSVRLGITSVAGRNATGVTGDFEWEACNLLDRGCEFGGSPQSNGELGGTRLPAYLRLDLGARKHWHLSVAGRDLTLAVFGTVSNLFGRTNVLTIATDPATGRRTAIEMRPRAPVVVGLDWRF